MIADHFSARLKHLREAAGLTQQELATKAGFQRGAVARWELGTREPSWKNIVALANALGVSCEAFTEEAPPVEPSGPGRPRKEPPAEEKPSGEKAKGKRRGKK